ncbi:hypothetical protein PTSG_10519 [Salpingoeca rosetta]|uniref:Uncharacterized protein n=1 Tax=Salpingoeca rosetta (strain ATCC 50818 / BSB-021) TaxID=946362 RepID=F2UPW5_SALR5|nr:uncharacterized protein PTSG_10519 [Salpingoeca rosetta]EGD79670.1 hypothetical protein PTSG_10519 [Salpingoeca rosetta]|eukprot:XP_004988898.1 hypothetical protein PTSG_10519 [Salpingoeca rosetta]
MLDGTLDCLSNLHFIHILQLFRVLTTLTFDRQRTAAAGLKTTRTRMLSQSNEELKRIGTTAAATVTCTWLALANDTNTSIDRDHLSSVLQVLHLIYVDKCVQPACSVATTLQHPRPAFCPSVVASVSSPSTNGDGGLTIDHRRRRPFGFRSLADPSRQARVEGAETPKRTFQHDNTRQHDCGLRRRTGAPQARETCPNFSSEYTRARSGQGHARGRQQKDAAGAVRDEAQAAVGDWRRVRGHDAPQDRRGDRVAEARCWNADLFMFLMSLQPFGMVGPVAGDGQPEPRGGSGGGGAARELDASPIGVGVQRQRAVPDGHGRTASPGWRPSPPTRLLGVVHAERPNPLPMPPHIHVLMELLFHGPHPGADAWMG